VLFLLESTQLPPDLDLHFRHCSDERYQDGLASGRLLLRVGERFVCRAISLTPQLLALRMAISSRSAKDKQRPDNGAKLTGRIPPASRNHQFPTGDDTLTDSAATPLDSPLAIPTQKR
jgi:hypothetical protein